MDGFEYLAANLTFQELFAGRDNRLYDTFDTVRFLFDLVSLSITLVLKTKFKIMDSNTHFRRLYNIAIVFFVLYALVWTSTLIAILSTEHIRVWFLLIIWILLFIIRTLSPFVQPLCSVFLLAYTVSFIFQKDETLKNAIRTKEGSLLVWLIGIFYALWCHPLNSYNVLSMYYSIENSIFEVHNINPIDFIFLVITTGILCFKYIDVCRYPKVLSTVELANLLHITLMVIFDQAFITFKISKVLLSNNPTSQTYDRLHNLMMSGTWNFYGTVAPFLYPYSMMFTIVFFDTNTRIRYSRRVRFYTTKMEVFA